MTTHAHTSATRPWEPLFTPAATCPALSGLPCPACASLHPDHGHLNKVAWLCGEFAAAMFPPATEQEAQARAWGRAAGLWHDLGKFSAEFQAYLRKSGAKADPHREEPESGMGGRVDHSTAGAAHASQQGNRGGLLAYVIAGHHCGLADGVDLFEKRLKGEPPEWRPHAEAAGVPLESKLPQIPAPAGSFSSPRCFSLHAATFTRMLFSCLVDADRLATEAFMNPESFAARPRWPAGLLATMRQRLSDHVRKLRAESSASVVNRSRSEIAAAAEQASDLPPGFFHLTVPTGGGKTLTGLGFALAHAVRHSLRRVIYVAPFTSILDQTARIFREVFADVAGPGLDGVVEHHSNRDVASATLGRDQAAENWDAPLVLTTNVQFYESLFAAPTSAARKLHRIARSVILLDEAQSLPPSLLAPCLAALRTLARAYGVSVVLCTATQPAILQRPDFPIGIPPADVRAIVPDFARHFDLLRRVRVGNLGRLTDGQLVDHICGEPDPSALVIVHTTGHAAELFQLLKTRGLADGSLLHLSARMCPAHRKETLKALADQLARRLPTVLVATPVVEAGVDISFPRVYRANSGLDALAQAAGRCNRHGELRDASGNPALGEVWRFTPADHPIPDALHEIRTAAQKADELLAAHAADLLGPAAIEAFFRLYYWTRQADTQGWDNPGKNKPGVLTRLNQADPWYSKDWSHTFAFASASEDFRLIRNDTRAVVVPHDDTGRRLRERLCNQFPGAPFTWADYREAQAYSVNVQGWQYDEWVANGTARELQEGALAVLQDDTRYDERTGLTNPADGGFIL